MKLLFLLMIPLFLFAENQQLNSAILNVKQEVPSIIYDKELKLLHKYENQLKSLEPLQQNVYDKQGSTRFLLLDKLFEIQKNSQSLIISQYMLDKTLSLLSTKDTEKFFKYTKPSIDLLYKNGFCDGYLFEGSYQISVNRDILKAKDIYQIGLKRCKIQWKNFEIRSRLNILKYTKRKTEKK